MSVQARATVELNDDVAPLLDNWNIEEVEELLTGCSEALEEVGVQMYAAEAPIERIDVILTRSEIEAYLSERRLKEAA